MGLGMKKRRMHGGTALIDQPFSVRQATDSSSNFFKDPMGTFGYGLNKRGRPRKHRLSHAGSSTRKMHGGTALIDQPFTVRQATDSTSHFFKDPMGTFGYGLKKKKVHHRKKRMSGKALFAAGY